MIPKAGDVVDLNPLFVKAYKMHLGLGHTYPGYIFGMEDDGHIHVESVVAMDDGGFLVTMSNKHGSYEIDGKGCTDFRWSPLYHHGWSPGLPLFVPVGSSRPSAATDLRSMNTQPGRTACASCGGQLRNPMPPSPRFQHCPKCEP